MTPGQLFGLFKKSFAAWNDDDAASMGAAIAYYTLFSIAPLLVMVIAIASLIVGRDAAYGHILGELRGLMGDAGGDAVEGLLRSADTPAKSIIATITSTAALLLGATSVFAELYGDLNRIWRSPSLPKASGIWHLVRTRILSFGMILGIGFLLLVSLVISAGLSAMGEWWGKFFAWELLVQSVNFVISLAIVTAAFAMIYKFLPRAQIAWKDVWVGALATGVLFTVGKLLIGLYLGKTEVASGFGAAGSMVILMIWVYYSAQTFLLGAEFTWVYAYRHGSRAGEAPPEPPVPRRGRPVNAKDTTEHIKKHATGTRKKAVARK